VVRGTGVESFSSWVNEQLVDKSQAGQASRPSEEIQSHEDAMLVALELRDIPAALMHACALVYLDPGHKSAQRIKSRCMSAMRDARARGAEDVPFMRVRWSELRDRPLSPDAVCVLSCIDGQSKIEVVVGRTELAPARALEVLADLLEQGLVGMRAPRA
jgi:hypothetical protein